MPNNEIEAETEVVNLTAHDIVLFNPEGDTIIDTFPPSGKVLRVSSSEEKVGDINGVPIFQTQFGELDKEIMQEVLRARLDSKIYLVSFIAYQAIRNQYEHWPKEWVVVPNTAPTENGAVRDQNGRIKGVRSFQRPG